MNKKIVLWLGVLALTAAPAVAVLAQEGTEEDGPVAGMADESAVRPDMPEGAGQEFGQERPGPGMKGGMGRMMNRKRLARGGPGFLSEEETLALIKKHDPVFAKKVEDLKSMASARYRMLMQLSGRPLAMAKMSQDEGMEKDAVRELSLELDSKELSAKYGAASDADKKVIKESLRARLGELFDLKTRGQELRVKRMETEIGKLKKNLEARKVNKAKIVDQRLEQMTGEGIGW